MKHVTLQQLEKDFDRIFDDVVENKEHYTITAQYISEEGTYENKDVLLIPHEDYDLLKETYQDWIDGTPSSLEF
jgi:PHD/YefM family antitoxin component YafN of YafNO toxin-antitoxin module